MPAATGRTFYKMSGSGNDFVMFDATTEDAGPLLEPETIQRLCARSTGIGADGVVFLERSESADFRMRYVNSDGSPAALCGNATLCSARLAGILGIASPGALRIETDAGIVGAIVDSERPEIELETVTDVSTELPIRLADGERWIGFAEVGVPHLVVRVDDVRIVDVVGRGRPLRHHDSLPAGANVNFVSRSAGGWLIRTYERGVEGETLACGTGAVASAIQIVARSEASGTIALETRSGEVLAVRLERAERGWRPRLRGEARLVFTGALGELRSDFRQV
ncbi:MAG: diaminopimelate epimerase [Gemmatimonadaceae bacterium]|nr:diaminopimelate epimerase [Gemmatimonadaceae bacterium]